MVRKCGNSANLRSFSVADRSIGEHDQPYLVAEMACAHQGEAALVLRMVEIAAQAKVDALQVQILTPETLVSCRHPSFNLALSLAIDRSVWMEAIAATKASKLAIWANVFDPKSLEFALTKGCDALKLHSTDLSNPVMLEGAAQSNVPVSISVGASTIAEIESAINFMARKGRQPDLLMHGYQAYPTALDDSRLRYIRTLSEHFDRPVGFQDHIAPSDPFAEILPLMAIGAGAVLIEKHFTYDEGLTNIDHHSSMPPAQFGNFAATFRVAATALGRHEEQPLSDAEQRYRAGMKKAVVVSRDMPSGTVLARSDIAFLRSEKHYFSPLQAPKLYGRKILRDMLMGEALGPQDLE